MKASRLSCLVRSAIAHASQRRFILRPSATHLDPYLEINLAAKKPLHVEPRGRGNLFQFASARSDDDRLVSLFFYHDGRVNAPHAALFFEFFDFHAGAVRKLFTEKAEQLFPDQFSSEKPLVPVGQVVL